MMKNLKRKKGKGKLRKKVNPLSRYRANVYSTFRSKLEGVIVVGNATGAAANYACSMALNFPGRGVQTGGTYGLILSTSPQELTTLSAAFREYRVDGLKVSFLGSFVETSAASTAGSENPNVMYWAKDTADPSLLTENFALNSGNRPKMIENGKPQSFTMLQPKQNRNKFINVLNINNAPTTATTNITQVGFADPYAAIKILILQIPQTQYVGRLYLTWHCTWRNIALL